VGFGISTNTTAEPTSNYSVHQHTPLSSTTRKIMPNPGFNSERDPSTCRSGNGKYASVYGSESEVGGKSIRKGNFPTVV
jgi:hypothetical protein